MDPSAVRDALTGELDADTLYRILSLRSAVFVVEQDCVYLDLDGRDLEQDTRQLWIESDGAVLATLRLLRDPGGADGADGIARIGRVATTPSARSAGLARQLMTRALELSAGREIVLDAQSYLVDWYARLGFVRASAEYLEDGIPHVTMRRPAN